MRKPTFDPGLTQKFEGPLRRVVNKDGSFNVHRSGASWRDFHPYLHLINLGWPSFLAVLFAGYLVANTLFAAAYYSLGAGQLLGADASTGWGRFLNDFFFSSHTLSTVGYGNITPKSTVANVVASFEALVGVLGFAVATGLLFGRVSRPSAKIGLQREYGGGSVSGGRRPAIPGGQPPRQFADGAGSPAAAHDRRNRQRRAPPQLSGVAAGARAGAISSSDLDHRAPHRRRKPALGQVGRGPGTAASGGADPLIKAYDDTFSQTVLVRHSYRHDEIVWGKRFAPAFFVDGGGDLVLELRKVGEMAS